MGRRTNGGQIGTRQPHHEQHAILDNMSWHGPEWKACRFLGFLAIGKVGQVVWRAPLPRPTEVMPQRIAGVAVVWSEGER
jgi:hypothetical protein